MIPALVLNPTSSDWVLDLCAAPGSKASQLLDMMLCADNDDTTHDNKNHDRIEGLLVANEPSFSRARILVHQLGRLPRTDRVIVTNVDARAFPQRLRFDKILCDVPCSVC